jgi:glycosyltransferase involved in cell wall biosynthesis
MNAHSQPLVSVLTPVYNGAAFLDDCMQSVLAQTYQNFEYIVVNNCSTDRTLEIALDYARRDRRIRVVTNTDFVPVIRNHNIAFGLMSETSKYCKVVSADDFIFPECLARMVELAEAHSSVGIVGSYQLGGDRVKWQGFDYPRAVFPGAEICRQVFLREDRYFGFGSPTSLMYRADIVRETNEFYPNPSPHSDTSACFQQLQKVDYGFVYQVLSFGRIHADTQSALSESLNREASANLNNLLCYGSIYLTQNELTALLNERLRAYRRYLAANYLFESRDEDFWAYHKKQLADLGYPLRRTDLLLAILRELSNPAQVIRKASRRLSPHLALGAARHP